MSKNKQQFFLDVFNNILDFNNSKVTIIFDNDGNIWFGLKDLLKMLGYNADKARKRLEININNKKYIKNINRDPNVPIHPNTIFINESGLYELLTKSTKPTAKTFLNKYFTDIMPQIRKTGKYISNKNDMNQIKKLNDKISNYKTELNYYNDKYKFEPSTYGYIYICEDNQIKNGIKIKCYKAGYDFDMEKRMREYKVGNFKYKLLTYIPLKIDRKQIEKCIKMRLKPHLTKLITDTICWTSLTKLKSDIIDCINFNYQHICHCAKCSKVYNINLLDKHSCNVANVKDFIDYKGQQNTIKKLSKKYSKKISKKSSKKISKKLSKKSSKK